MSKRLAAAAAFVSEGSRLCDVGCDHAYLSIALVRSGRVCHALAMDVRKGPLAIAASHIGKAGLSGQIETRLSDGLAAMQMGEADCIVFAGMGGGLVVRLLQAETAKACSAKEWILQPQSELYRVRRWLRLQGFAIIDEELVVERGKYYPVLKVKPHWQKPFSDQEEAEHGAADAVHAGKRGAAGVTGEDTADPLEMEAADTYGPILLERKHPLLRVFLQKEKRRLVQILAELPQERTERRAELLHELAVTEYAIVRMKSHNKMKGKGAIRSDSQGCLGADQ